MVKNLLKENDRNLNSPIYLQQSKFSSYLFSIQSLPLLFRAKRKENQEERYANQSNKIEKLFSFSRSPSNQTTKTILVHSQSAHENQAPFYPPPPAPFSSRPSSSKSQNVIYLSSTPSFL